eukprot:g16445.t1
MLVSGSLRGPTCNAFLVPAGAPTVMWTASTLVQRGRFSVPWGRQHHHLPASGFAAPRPASTNHKLSTCKRVRGGGGMEMLAGLPAAVGSMINPAVVRASSRAVAELLCCCVLGVVAAKKGILTPVNVAALSKIVYGIFLPALLMVNVAKTIISQPVASLLPIPVFAAIQITIGLVISGAAMRLLNINPNTEMGREAKVCAAFQNSGILPLIFLNAMFRGSPELLTRGVAYVSFYLMGWSPTFWTIGNDILTGHLDDPAGGKKQIVGSGIPTAKISLSERAASIPGKLKSIASGTAARKILSPPIMACLAGLMIGLSPPLRWLLMREGAPLGPMWAAFSNLTAAYTPSGVLVLAGSLSNCPRGKWFTKDTGKTMLAVGMARWLLLPLVTSGLLFGGVKYGLVPQDPMLLLVLLIESCMPSAQNSVIMLQVVGLQDAAGRCARMLCTLYLMSIVPVSILLTVFISALKLA